MALFPLLTRSITFASISVGVNLCFNSYSTYAALRARPGASFHALHPPIETVNLPNDQDPKTSRAARPKLELTSAFAPLSSPSSAAAREQKKDQLVKELERLGQSQRNTLSADDYRRATYLADEFTTNS